MSEDRVNDREGATAVACVTHRHPTVDMCTFTYPRIMPMMIAFIPGMRLIEYAFFSVLSSLCRSCFRCRLPPETNSLKSHNSAGARKMLHMTHVQGGERARATMRRAVLQRRRCFACLKIVVISLLPDFIAYTCIGFWSK